MSDTAKLIVQEALDHNTLFPYIQKDDYVCSVVSAELERFADRLLLLKENNELPDTWNKTHLLIDLEKPLRSQVSEGYSLFTGLHVFLAKYPLLKNIPPRIGNQVGPFLTVVTNVIYDMVVLDALSIGDLEKKRLERSQAKRKEKENKKKKGSINPTQQGVQRTSKSMRDFDDEPTARQKMRRKHIDS